ncbi:MAG: FMN-binding negative transcriptional regulator, partial [Verrucomicrobiales bacterium]
FIEENSFGLLLSSSDGEIHDTHTPFVYSEDGRHLLGHIARANPQWQSWEDGATAKVVFRGPHAYISPRFYESEFAVPTWNYTAVSVAGLISVIDEEAAVLDFLDRLTAHNEPSEQPWVLDRTDERYIRLLSGIVVFSISIDRVEASFKMNQNKNEADRRKVITSLAGTGCPFDSEVAGLMGSTITDAEQDIDTTA